MSGKETELPGRSALHRKAATIKEVAAKAGVSTATASRALNDDPKVLSVTAERVRNAAARLGYSANHAARSLKTRATRTIGVIAPDLATDFFMLLADRIEGELAARGYGLLLCSSRESLAEEKRLLGFFAERSVEGVIAIPATASGSHFKAAATRGMPLVLADRSPRGAGTDAVLVDNEGGACAATKALAGLGHRRIGLIGGDPRLSTARERHAGYLRALSELGLPRDEAFERYGTMHIDSGYRILGEMLSMPGSPRAYFVVNADMHIGCTNWLMTAGRAAASGAPVGRVELAAFDEMPYSPLLCFCRFAVEQPIAMMGQEAVRLILERIAGDGGDKPRILRLSTRLVSHG
ncbi:MAG: LacI family DNA-binding transcriptional regulator [Spirochaetota bacterium]